MLSPLLLLPYFFGFLPTFPGNENAGFQSCVAASAAAKDPFPHGFVLSHGQGLTSSFSVQSGATMTLIFLQRWST